MEVIYEIKYHPLVVSEDIPKLGGSDRQRIKVAIEQKLTSHPDLFGVPLRQSLKGHRKLRVGDYRVVFRIEGNQIVIITIWHRSDVYVRAEKRSR